MLDLLSDILTRLSMRGTLYFRTSFSKPWGVAVPQHQNVARFHYAHRGSCLVAVAGLEEPASVEQGDLIIIPHGAPHELYCGHKPEETILPLETVLEESGYDGSGVLVYGGNDQPLSETQLICGHFSFNAQSRHILFERLPPLVHIKNYGESAGKWMDATLRVIGDEAGAHRMGGDLIALKMSEAILAQAIRSFLESDLAEDWKLAGFSDKNLAQALDAFHQNPHRAWTVETLASSAGMSRTSFAVAFQKKMAMTPMDYVTSWRMELAKQALLDPLNTVADVAESVGYASDSAFARVFKKETGFTPAGFKRLENANRATV
ncbi:MULTISPECIES: AraC family transcriptional regulator [unclassified Ruegeria]|uniref:AraC family transcriptional regulator n=1 Tax=unclassified Ruegeria TaxID=2625375 RepID=UPI0014894657|nr:MULTISPECIES: AraC family transcriptional regulator [unclassified Ruegeria]